MTAIFLSDIISVEKFREIFLILRKFQSTHRQAMRKGWVMDIASISMAMSQSTALTKVGTAVLSNAMDTNEALGQGLVKMIDAAAMERSVNPHIGSNFDMLV